MTATKSQDAALNLPYPDDLSSTDTITALALQDVATYEGLRLSEAKRLGMRTGVLDRLINDRRRTIDSEKHQFFRDVEPWDDPVDGGELLAELVIALDRYVKMPNFADYGVALWILNTYVHDASQVSPVLAITSPVKRCGKTTLLTVLQGLVKRPMQAANMTPAVLFRATEKYQPTWLIDEADTFLRDANELIGVLNSGHFKGGAMIMRTVGDDYEPHCFTTWAPKAIALIGHLPLTLADRSILVQMRRRRRDETIERLRLDRLEAEFSNLRRKCARWAEDNFDVVQNRDPDVPTFLNDRAADNWRPLLAIAEITDFRDCALSAIKALQQDDDEETVRTMLLEDIRTLLDGQEKIASAWLIDRLKMLDERPWATYNRGKEISPRQVARMLGDFGIKPKSIRIGDSVSRGYEATQFRDAFSRYLPNPSATALQNGSSPTMTGPDVENTSATPLKLVAHTSATAGSAVADTRGTESK